MQVTRYIVHIMKDCDYCDSLVTIVFVIKILGDHYFQNQVGNSQGHNKGTGEAPITLAQLYQNTLEMGFQINCMCIVGEFVCLIF